MPASRRLVANSLGILNRLSADGPNCKAIAHFGQVEQVNVKVGISYVSIAKARASIVREVGEKDFETVRAEAAATWEQALSRILVEGGTEEQKKLFYICISTLGVQIRRQNVFGLAWRSIFVRLAMV